MTTADDRVVLLSIHERWADAILDGRKLYEYRKQPPAIDPPYRVLLYATRGPSEIRGEARVECIVTGDLEDVIAETIAETPHTPDDIRAYFDAPTGTALYVTDVKKYTDPLTRTDIETVIPGFYPPQNFRYITDAEYRELVEV